MNQSPDRFLLRPLSTGQLFDRAIRLYRHNFLQFIGIVALVQVPVQAIQLLISLSVPGSGQSPLAASDLAGLLTFGGWGITLLAGILATLLIQISTGALARAIGNEYLGSNTGILDAYRQIRSQWGTLIGLVLLSLIITIGLAIWFIVPCVGWFTGAGILGFWAYIITPLAAPIVILERQGARAALRRAWDLARRRFWWALGYVLLLALFQLLIVAGPAALINSGFVLLLTSEVAHSSYLTTATVVAEGVNLVLTLLFTPLQLTAMILMYFDLRVRTEGFDLTLGADQDAGAAVSAETLIANAPPPRSDGLVTGEEMGKFAAITIVVVGLFLIFSLIIQFLLIRI